MFRKLRNRFLLLNMAITTLVMALAFLAIYLVSYGNLQRQTAGRLDKPDKLDAESVNVVAFTAADAGDESASAPQIITNLNTLTAGDDVSFTIAMDRESDVVMVRSVVNMPESAYAAAAEAAMSGAGMSMVDIEGRDWAYQAVSPTRITVTQEDGAGAVTLTEAMPALNTSFVFVDVTAEMEQLRSLPRLFALVGVPMLALIFLVSLLIANRTIAPVADAWDRQRRFVADASHELKTPLAIIQANCDALEGEEGLGEGEKWVSYIRAGTDRMAGLVSGLLDLARIEDGCEAGAAEVFDLGGAVRAVAAGMMPLAMERGIELALDAQAGVNVVSDRAQVASVASVLLENALKYAGEGGRVAVRVSKVRRQAVLEVENTGPGIAPEDVPRVFDRFFRADPSRAAGGQGLGLSIAKATCDQLGAALTCESEVGGVTVFRFVMGMG